MVDYDEVHAMKEWLLCPFYEPLPTNINE